MSEKIYACLLRLFPSRFREAYGEQVLQLFRDRARDERGLFRSLRLWLDLLLDLAVSLPSEYGYAAMLGATPQSRVDGAPSFFVLEERSPGLLSLTSGLALALAALSVFSLVLIHTRNRPFVASFRQLSQSARPRPSGAASPATHSHGDAVAFAQQSRAQLATTSRSPSADENTLGESTNALLPDGSSPSAKPQALPPQSDANAPPAAAPDSSQWNAAARQRLVQAAAQNIRDHYFDSAIAQKTASALLAHANRGDYNTMADADVFAELLTRQMRDASRDMHFEMVYSSEPLPPPLPEPTPVDLARYRQVLERDNCAFRKVEILPHNIGYLKLDAFPDAAMCERTARAAMAAVNQADAVIFDLRDNRGGFASMVLLLSAYLFDHPEYMYDPRESPRPQSWTASPVAGSTLSTKPVYVLTSQSTISAAEQFCYDLKMLKRITLVGETTHGSAHAGVFYRIDPHFGIAIPNQRPINPFSNSDWESTGIQPDVKVSASEALETAEKLAATQLQHTPTRPKLLQNPH